MCCQNNANCILKLSCWVPALQMQPTLSTNVKGDGGGLKSPAEVIFIPFSTESLHFYCLKVRQCNEWPIMSFS